MKIQANQPPKRNNAHFMLTTAAGAAVGSVARYVIPTKAEFSNLKACKDTFFSNASTMARGTNRSILKYAGLGALIAAGICGIKNLLTKKPEIEAQEDTFEYSKYAALIDASEYACEILIYED